MESCKEGGNKIYRCSFSGCLAIYSKPGKLKIHERKHTGERPYVCDILDCKKTFTNLAHLKRHKSNTHEKSDEVICDIEGCGQVLSNRYALQKHKSRCHNPDTFPFSCKDCSSKFKKKRQLQQHLAIHTEGMIYRCNLCEISFSIEYSLKKHLRNHKTHTCDCGKVFHRWSELCSHRRSCCLAEKVHQCIICKKTFATSSNLTYHSLNVHVEESKKEIHTCPYLNCNRSYLYKKNLTSHIKARHENSLAQQEFSCPRENCETIFKYKKNLKNHIRVVHDGLPEKERKPRKPRKDKGIPRGAMKSMASILSGEPLTPKENLALVKEQSQKRVETQIAAEYMWGDRSNSDKNCKDGPDMPIEDMKSVNEDNVNYSFIETPVKEPITSKKESESFQNYKLSEEQINVSNTLNDEGLLKLCTEIITRLQDQVDCTSMEQTGDGMLSDELSCVGA